MGNHRQDRITTWKFVSITLLIFNYPCENQGVKCLSSLHLLSCGLPCNVIMLLLVWGAGWAALQARLEDGKWRRTRRWVCMCLCMCGTGECCCLLTWPSIRQCPCIYPPPPYLQTLCAPPNQGPSVQLSARAGISTLISHLWHPNELRLLLLLWEPTDYQTGDDHSSMARGGIYTADLAAKERGIKMVEKTEEQEREKE